MPEDHLQSICSPLTVIAFLLRVLFVLLPVFFSRVLVSLSHREALPSIMVLVYHDHAICLIDDVRVHTYLDHHRAHGNSDYVFCFEIAYLFLSMMSRAFSIFFTISSPPSVEFVSSSRTTYSESNWCKK